MGTSKSKKDFKLTLCYQCFVLSPLYITMKHNLALEKNVKKIKTSFLGSILVRKLLA